VTKALFINQGTGEFTYGSITGEFNE
jgi:hypothetical protein